MNSDNQHTILEKLSPRLFWDMDSSQIDLDKYPSHIIQRVLEYGEFDDWKLIKQYYGLEKIVKYCQSLRTLAPCALSYISCISKTPKESFRCYNFSQYTQ